ncbi:hypothetical protein IM660_11280 [Ruania alkalisoli]|uniref:DUF4282 domain-containing protein n=1 Tax=Ruania alkalisoli TaxID=2779775 RepID=A0A7M1SP24_9MICO|nr:hypothetical protein [Ruania alkalisoli]QOR69288.1 hypothetical protein IM660_11280 [Ruania alkalisoli]
MSQQSPDGYGHQVNGYGQAGQGGYAPGQPAYGYSTAGAQPNYGYPADGAQAAYGQPQPGPGAPGAPGTPDAPGTPMRYTARASGPGLFDTTFASSTIRSTAKTAFVAVILLAGGLAFTGMFSAIADFSQLRYGGFGLVLYGLSDLVLYGALAFAVLVLGRLLIDHVVQSANEREAVAAAREKDTDD